MSFFKGTERTIFMGALLALLCFSYFLYDDSLLFPKSNTNSLELIGVVAGSQNDVRRKNLDTFSWLPANKKDTIFQNDSIFTGDKSDATIQLDDGTLINIKPNSLITLNLKNGQMSLDLKYGDLEGEIAKGASVKITSGEEAFEIKSSPTSTEKSRIKFKKNPSDTLALKLLTGDAKYIDSKKQKAEALPSNTLVSIGKDGKFNKVAPELTLISPENSTWIRYNENDPLNFEWLSTGEIASYRLEISPSEDFSSISATQDTAEKKLAVIDPMTPGAYFWRVKALDKAGQITTTSLPAAMSLTNLSIPEITQPQAGYQYNLEVEATPEMPLSSSVDIRWTPAPHFKKFAWQLSESQDFSSILKEGESSDAGVITPPISNGNYWVRVQGHTESEIKSPWSSAISFSLNLKERSNLPPQAPILLTKQVKFAAPSREDRNPASAKAPVVAWKPVLQSKSYRLEISRDANFKNSAKYEINNSRAVWSKFKPGLSYYRVYARGTNNLISNPSEVGTIEVSVGQLILNPLKPIQVVSSTPTPQEATVSWSDVPLAKSYLLQIDSNTNFKEPQIMEYTSTSGRLTLNKPGKYAVRVQALDENNKPITDFSNIEEVLYSYRAPLTAPSLLEPFNNASIFLQSEMEPFIWLEWKKVASASIYLLEVSATEDFSKILISTSVKDNRFLIKEKLPLGRIYWRVQAKSETESSDWTKQREFTLYHQKNETFIK